MTTTRTAPADTTIRIDGADYDQPVCDANDPTVYWVGVHYDDGDRFLTQASSAVLAAWGVK